MWLLLVGVLLSLLCGILLSIFIKQLREKIPNLPGPKLYPVFGSLFEFSTTPQGITQDILRIQRDYGKVSEIWLGPLQNVLINDAVLAEKILQSSINIRKANHYQLIFPMLGNGLLLSTGRKWHQRRKILTPAFHFTILEEAVETFHKASNILVKQLEKESHEEPFDIYPYITLFALDIICETAMGIKVNAQIESNSTYVLAVKQACMAIFERAFSILGQSDFIYFNITQKGRSFKKAIKTMHDMTNRIIKERRTAFEAVKDSKSLETKTGSKNKPVFLDALLHASMTDGISLSNEDIQEEVDTFMFEGHDTVSSALSFTLYLLANHPKIQDEVFAEIQNILGDDISKAPTIKQFNQMKYLDQVIKESLRLFPSVPMIGRELTEAVKYGDVTLPVGVQAMLFFYSIHRDTDYYTDPEIFNPDRFSTDSTPINIFSYTPFSAGPRNCIGQKFAVLELKSSLSKLVHNFEFSSAGSKFDLQLVMALVLKSVNGIHLKMKKRIIK